jgi:homoserine dehydrogenase
LKDGAVQARVYPALVPQDDMLGKVDGVYNAVQVHGSLCGNVLFHGMGAGRGPTTSAMVGDLIDVCRRVGFDPVPPVQVLLDDQSNTEVNRSGQIRSIDDLMAKYYLRLSVVDQPGVLAQIAQILGDWSISIASVLQIDSDPSEQTAEIVITTHPAVEASVQSSLKLMSDLEVVRKVNNLLRIEE